MRSFAIFICLGLLIGSSVYADSWTNRAGHVLSADLVSIDGEHVILRGTNGRIRRLPLSSLKPSEQQRAIRQSGTEPLPSELTACFSQAQEDIRRAAQFLHGGRITPENYAVRCQAIIKRFECLACKALEEQKAPNDRVLLKLLKKKLTGEQQHAAANPPSRPRILPAG